MANYAIINTDNKVTNVIVAESLEIAQQATGANCIELLPEAGINDTWDGTQFIKFVDPVIEPTE
jgi:hypothetical protein